MNENDYIFDENNKECLCKFIKCMSKCGPTGCTGPTGPRGATGPTATY